MRDRRKLRSLQWNRPGLIAALAFLLGGSGAFADESVQFRLLGPATAQAVGGLLAGDSMQLTGGGSVDPEGGKVIAGGEFTHLDDKGEVVRHGTWRATELRHFDAQGTLELTALFVTSHGVEFQQKMRLATNGTVVGSFSRPVSGVVWFGRAR